MIRIFQINKDKDKNDVAFMAYDWVYKTDDEFDFSIYDEVWSGEPQRKWKTLEGIFEIFNLYHPEDFRGHSLSVSDIVQIVKPDTEDVTEEVGYYYCDNFGWKKLKL